MSNPWKKVTVPTNVQNLSDIMSEEYAKELQIKEEVKFAEQIGNSFQSEPSISTETSDISPEILKQIEDSNAKEYCDSDAVIAKVLQCQFDKEYDEEINRIEKKRNGVAKVAVSLDNYRHVPDHLVYESDSDDDAESSDKKDWDRFETNAKEYASLPKKGFIMKDGEMVTKHDSVINGRRNACKVMAFPLEVRTGDGAGFDMKLSNSVFNQLKEYTRNDQARKSKMLDRKESHATAEMGLDEATRLILFKLINNGLLEKINGVIATGKEAIVLHANGDESYPDQVIPKECAIKVFKTTLNEFKTRDKYIEADYRFKNRFSKQNPRKIVHMWAEKELHNLTRLKSIGINCPDMVVLKKHILVMSLVGKNHVPAPKLREVILSPEEWQSVYKEVVDDIYKMYNVGKLIHADLSEFNILWWEKKCWYIDVSQSVQPDHPRGLEFLLRDCRNMSRFFKKKGVKVKTGEELFKHVTGFEEIDMNMLDGVHPVYNSLSTRFEVAPDDNRIVSYPFDYCWEKNSQNKQADEENEDEGEDEFEEMWEHSLKAKIDDTATNFAEELKINVDTEENKVVNEKVDFGKEIDVTVPIDGNKSSTGTSKKS